MQESILTVISIDEFRQIIGEAVEKQLNLKFKGRLQEQKDEEKMLSPSEAAKLAQVTTATLRAWEMRKIIKGHRIGRKVYYSHFELLEAIKGAA